MGDDTPNPPASVPFDLTETDKQNLLAGDAAFHPHTWSELSKIIATNNLSILKRRPSALLRYIAWTNHILTLYPSITAFVCRERLHWTPLPASTPATGPLFDLASPKLFASERDYRMLLNDWPYGVEEGIWHLVVWLKQRVPVEEGGALTEEARERVEGFVDRVFRGPSGEGQRGERVMWFRNWGALQSVKGLEHFHVLVRGVAEGVLREWVGVQEPLPGSRGIVGE